MVEEQKDRTINSFFSGTTVYRGPSLGLKPWRFDILELLRELERFGKKKVGVYLNQDTLMDPLLWMEVSRTRVECPYNPPRSLYCVSLPKRFEGFLDFSLFLCKGNNLQQYFWFCSSFSVHLQPNTKNLVELE